MKVAVAEVEVEVEVLLELVDVLVMLLEIEAEVEVVESIVVLFVEVAVLAVADVVEVTSVVDPVDGGEAEVDELVLVDETNDEVMLLEVIELEGSLEPDVVWPSTTVTLLLAAVDVTVANVVALVMRAAGWVAAIFKAADLTGGLRVYKVRRLDAPHISVLFPEQTLLHWVSEVALTAAVLSVEPHQHSRPYSRPTYA